VDEGYVTLESGLEFGSDAHSRMWMRKQIEKVMSASGSEVVVVDSSPLMTTVYHPSVRCEEGLGYIERLRDEGFSVEMWLLEVPYETQKLQVEGRTAGLSESERIIRVGVLNELDDGHMLRSRRSMQGFYWAYDRRGTAEELLRFLFAHFKMGLNG